MNNNEPTKSLVPFGKTGVQLSSMEDAFRFAVAVSKSGFAPKGIETPEAIMIAVQFGAELGLTPMSSLQSLAIINGRPAVYGDAALALVRGSGELESYQQSTTGEGDNMKAIVRVKRKNEAEIVSEFSVADAKKAQLWGKAGPWSQYAGRMLMWRARGFALRDGFGDILRGLATAEEVQDMPPLEHIKAAKIVISKPKDTPALSEHAASGSENPATATTAESAKPEAGTAQSSSGNPPTPIQELDLLLAQSKITFADIKPHLPKGLAPRDATTTDNLTEANAAKIVDSWDVLMDILKSERQAP